MIVLVLKVELLLNMVEVLVLDIAGVLVVGDGVGG